ncbi:fibronectin type III domain-containing protein [Actinophytocola sp.]|uniref:fibronectin type III domain-containing protein n=1 Tax=Actinophytocola sp. TaxID=1872138 RepID=UPI003D69FE9F
MPVLLVVAALVAGVTAAVTGATSPTNALRFLTQGHWIFNVPLGTAFHVDGATAGVDASVVVGGEQGSSQVVQGDTSGYVVGSNRITVFGKSSLEVVDSTTPPAAEVPVPLEVTGGPYLVYREAGIVVRLGEHPQTISAGKDLGVPVATSDGTVWLRTGAGLICQLPSGADRVSCPVHVDEGHGGALTVVDDRTVFVDTTSDQLHPIEADGLGEGRALGVDVPDSARVASFDVAGRIAILDPDGDRMHLVDTAGEDPTSPVEVDLDDGDYDGPVSTGSVVAVVDRATDTVTTYDGDGERRSSRTLPKESGDPRLTRGEDDRIYVDGAEGEHVLVVDHDGSVAETSVGEDGREDDNQDDQDDEDEEDPDERERGSEPGAGEPGDEPGDTERRGPPDRDVPEDDTADEPREPEQPPPVPATPPGAPPGVGATPGDASAVVRWGAAAGNRAPVNLYTVSWAGGSQSFGGGVRAARITGLTNGRAYTFTVSAANSAGTGPGASAAPVTPSAAARPAAAPPGLEVVFDSESNDAVVSWGQPNLNGGTLLHYVAGVTGLSNQTVEGTSALWNAIPGDGEIVFTVRAVTRTPDGRTLTGATASYRIDQDPDVTISRGEDLDSPETDCHEPDCSYLNLVMTGFEPNTEYHIIGESTEDGEFGDDFATTDDDGTARLDELFWFGYVDETVWLTVETDDGPVQSNELYWEPQ